MGRKAKEERDNSEQSDGKASQSKGKATISLKAKEERDNSEKSDGGAVSGIEQLSGGAASQSKGNGRDGND